MTAYLHDSSVFRFLIGPMGWSAVTEANCFTYVIFRAATAKQCIDDIPHSTIPPRINPISKIGIVKVNQISLHNIWTQSAISMSTFRDTFLKYSRAGLLKSWMLKNSQKIFWFPSAIYDSSASENGPALKI